MSDEGEDIPAGNLLHKLENAKVHLWARFVETKCFLCFVCDSVKSPRRYTNSATSIFLLIFCIKFALLEFYFK